jgi:hypothetical protein
MGSLAQLIAQATQQVINGHGGTALTMKTTALEGRSHSLRAAWLTWRKTNPTTNTHIRMNALGLGDQAVTRIAETQ